MGGSTEEEVGGVTIGRNYPTSPSSGQEDTFRHILLSTTTMKKMTLFIPGADIYSMTIRLAAELYLEIFTFMRFTFMMRCVDNQRGAVCLCGLGQQVFRFSRRFHFATIEKVTNCSFNCLAMAFSSL